jgi:hypothetical protein
MNEKFKEFSLLAGGSHYPTVNSNLQQKFGEEIIKHVMHFIEREIVVAYEQKENWTAATLEALALEILNEFDMEIDSKDDIEVDENWDAEAELQKIIDEFEQSK